MKILAALLLVLISFIWGSTFIVVKNAIIHIPPFLFVSLRFAVATVLLLPLVYRERVKDGFVEGILTGFALFGGYAFQTFGLLFTSASKSAFITSMAVILVPFTGYILFRIKPTTRELIALFLAFLGLYQLILGPSFKLKGLNAGDVLTLLCAVSFALHISLTGHFTGRVNIKVFTFYQFLFVSLISMVFSILIGEGFKGLSGDPLLAMFFVGMFATAFAFIGQTWAQRHIRATKTALIFSLEPVFAAVFAFYFGGETLSLTQIIGGILILIGIIISGR